MQDSVQSLRSGSLPPSPASPTHLSQYKNHDHIFVALGAILLVGGLALLIVGVSLVAARVKLSGTARHALFNFGIAAIGSGSISIICLYGKEYIYSKKL